MKASTFLNGNVVVTAADNIWTGYLSFSVEPDDQGRAVIRDQKCCGVLQIMKPFYDVPSKDLVLLTLNPMGGMAQGDRYSIDVRVRRGSAAVIMPASANKIYRAGKSGVRFVQRLEVEDEAVLEFVPDLTIPHAGARVRQRTDCHLAPMATLWYGEILTPGRKASGEIFAYACLDHGLTVRREGLLVAQERVCWEPATLYPHSKILLGKYDYLMNLFIFVPMTMDREPLIASIAGLLDAKSYAGEDMLGGVSRLEGNGLVVKLLSSSSALAREMAAAIWALYRFQIRGLSPLEVRKN